MDYTTSNSYATDAGTGNRMHLQAQAIPTAVSDVDINGLIWEMLSVVKVAGIAPTAFDKTVPATYTQVASAIQSGKMFSAAAAGTADALTAAFNPGITVLKDGMALYVRSTSANATTTPTFTPYAGTIAAKAIVKGAGAALAVGDIAGGGHWIELQYDLTLDKWVLLNPATGVSATGFKPGTIFPFAGTTAPAGSLVCPLSSTNVSRTTYAALFAAIGTTWGAGDGSTTFGIPFFPADYAPVQASSNVGTSTVGQLLQHTHAALANAVNLYGTSGTYAFAVDSGQTGGVSTGGGAANLAAGKRVLICVQF